jgi:hypothetical protein
MQPRRVILGSAFEISTGQSVIIEDYTLSALCVPAPRQDALKLRRPSGIFSVVHASNNTPITFTLHGDQNQVTFMDTVIQLIRSKGNTARCVIWPAPPVSYEIAEQLARWAATEDGYLSECGNGRVHLRSHILSRPLRGEDGPIWRLSLASRSRLWHGECVQSVYIDAVSGAILSLAPRAKNRLPVSEYQGGS